MDDIVAISVFERDEFVGVTDEILPPYSEERFVYFYTIVS